MNKNVYSLIVIVFVTLLFSFSLFAASKKKSLTPLPVVVVTAKVTKATLKTKLSSWGSLIAKQRANLASQVDGQIESTNYPDGYKGVQAGAVVITLIRDGALAQVAADKVDVIAAQQKLDANQQLFNQQAASRSELLKAKTDLLKAKAVLAQDTVDLNQKQIKAPFTGDLGEFLKLKGDYVAKGDTIVRMVNKKQLEATYSITEDYLSKIKLGQQIFITSSSYPKKVFRGKVDYISPYIDSDTRSIGLKALVNNSSDLLSPGMFVSVQQVIDVHKNALMVPEEALQYDRNKASVFKVVGNKAILTPVKLGQMHLGGRVHVLTGLKLGDVVIIKGQEKLKNGGEIKIDSSTHSSTTHSKSLAKKTGSGSKR